MPRSSRHRIIIGALLGSAMAASTIALPDAPAMVLAAGAVPTAVCAQTIYRGTSPTQVLHTPRDVVVGPVRFGDLDPKLVAKINGSPLLGIKSPKTVGSTDFPELLVSAKGAKGPVSVAYGQAPSTTTTTIDLPAAPNRIMVQAPVSCGLPATGFVQYGGGFALAHTQCVTLTVSIAGGRVLARKIVPFGSVVCAPTPRRSLR